MDLSSFRQATWSLKSWPHRYALQKHGLCRLYNVGYHVHPRSCRPWIKVIAPFLLHRQSLPAQRQPACPCHRQKWVSAPASVYHVHSLLDLPKHIQPFDRPNCDSNRPTPRAQERYATARGPETPAPTMPTPSRSRLPPLRTSCSSRNCR